MRRAPDLSEPAPLPSRALRQAPDSGTRPPASTAKSPTLPLLRFFWVPILITIVAVAGAIALGGLEIGLIVAVLCILEISISFDNAIVNAAVLRTMSERWQRIFLTWGILIAVFGMRLVFPIVIVAVAAGLGLGEVIDQALNDQDRYAENLEARTP